MTESTPTYCYAHPGRETGLRCKRCDKPICASCAQRTATGYLCKECVQAHQKKFDTALGSDYLVVFFVAAFLSGIGAIATILITSVIWGIFVIGLAPLAGTIIANAVRRFIKNRQSPNLNYTLVAGVILGALPVMAFTALPLLGMLFMGGGMMSDGSSPLSSLYAFSPLIWQAVYLVLAVPAAYYQFSGLFFRR